MCVYFKCSLANRTRPWHKSEPYTTRIRKGAKNEAIPLQHTFANSSSAYFSEHVSLFYFLLKLDWFSALKYSSFILGVAYAVEIMKIYFFFSWWQSREDRSIYRFEKGRKEGWNDVAQTVLVSTSSIAYYMREPRVQIKQLLYYRITITT